MQKQKRTTLKAYVQNWSAGIHNVMNQSEVVYSLRKTVAGAQVLTFRLRLADAGKLNKVLNLGDQLALTLGASAVRVARNLGYIDIEVALPGDLHRNLTVRSLKRKGRSWVNLGQTATGTPVHINLAGNRTCHALISGITGSGKTVCEQLIAWELAMGNEPGDAAMLLIDGKKGRAWWGFERGAHLAHPVIKDTGEAIAALTWCLAELDRRKTNGNKKKLYVVVDEAKELIDMGGDDVANALGRLTALGRELHIHVILATQHPVVAAVGGSIAKANLPLRLTGMVADAGAAYNATGVKDSGAENLQGNGDFLLNVAGVVHRLQIAMLSNREIGRLPRVEMVERLDFGDYDLGRVLDVTEAVSKADALEPEHVAVALAHDRGINWLARELEIGSNKATRVRAFAQGVQAMLENIGYAVVKNSHPMLPIE